MNGRRPLGRNRLSVLEAGGGGGGGGGRFMHKLCFWGMPHHCLIYR